MVREAQPSYAVVPPRLIAEARPLDFLNTVSWAGMARARGERLSDYGELLHWCRHAGLLSRRDAAGLRQLAAADPAAAEAVRRRAVGLREALRRLVLRRGSSTVALRALNRALQGLAWSQRLTNADGALAVERHPQGEALERPLALIAQEALTLLAGEDLERIRSCANRRCGWVFLDGSRNRSRRWCQMETCGNQAKARAHYARRRAAAGS